jgi:predicted membrane chloride channel (bestrophin family)
MSLTAIAAAVTGYSEPVLAHAVPQFFPLLHVSSLPFSLGTPALALLFVFHTNNTCYGRFNKGMKAWESIVNRTRDIFRPALTWMQSPGDVHKVNCSLSYAVAISYSLKDHVT